jgi:hypothetical protein
VRAYLRNGGSFGAVADPGSALKANTFVEIYVPEIYADCRVPGAPTAVLSMRFVFFDVLNDVSHKIAFEKTYERRVPLAARSADAVMAGWNEALKQIMTEASFDQHNRASPFRSTDPFSSGTGASKPMS